MRNRAESTMFLPDYIDAIRRQLEREWVGEPSYFGRERALQKYVESGELRDWKESEISVETASERIRNNWHAPVSTEPEYTGSAAPKWVKDGVSVKVKTTPSTRRNGLRVGTNDAVYAGEQGVIRRREGNGWWDWRVEFSRGRFLIPSLGEWTDFVRVKS